MRRDLDLEAVYQNFAKDMIHNPPTFQKIPELHYAPANSGTPNIPGLMTKRKYAPFILLVVSIALFTFPGVVQAIWSEDRRVGDVVNACIGVGSVLVSVLFSILYCMFNTTVFSVNALRGEFLVTNDFAARIFLRSEVEKLESLACDPRLPKKFIANMNNCAVRSVKNGWLAIGKSIRYEEMISHGYYIIKEKGLVIDLIECRVLACFKKRDSKIVHLLRDAKQQNYLPERVHCFKGDEIFGGFEQNQSTRAI